MCTTCLCPFHNAPHLLVVYDTTGRRRGLRVRSSSQRFPQPARGGDRHEPRIVTVPCCLHPGDPGYGGGRGGRPHALESGPVQPCRPCWLRAAERYPGSKLPCYHTLLLSGKRMASDMYHTVMKKIPTAVPLLFRPYKYSTVVHACIHFGDSIGS